MFTREEIDELIEYTQKFSTVDLTLSDSEIEKIIDQN